MKSIKMISDESVQYANKILEEYYRNDLIPPEKKQYLTNLKRSIGPYMGIANSNENTTYMMDAASQIATLGLGFNPDVFFAPSYCPESWSNRINSTVANNYRKSLENFFKRQLQWEKIKTTICHSGAEANEIALGYAYEKRKHLKANKVLAFEGSFHGRMLVSLSSTWNEQKRAPFEWDEYKTVFAPYPNISDDQTNIEYSSEWPLLWEEARSNEFNSDKFKGHCPILDREIASLELTRSKLLTDEMFAIIIEPMQCEGGDQYASDRFYTGLISLANAFEVPIIFDEVQTGFHLGRDFFWHKQFNLKDSSNNDLAPDFITCAKKSQVGLVISKQHSSNIEEFQVSSLIRGHAHAIALDQSKNLILKLEEESKTKLKLLHEKFSEFTENPRGLGLAFAIDIKDPTHIAKLIQLRFKYGLLYYPAGQRTLRFRLNTSFNVSDLEYLFNQLSLIFNDVFCNEVSSSEDPTHRIKELNEKRIESLYNWHEALLEKRFQLSKTNFAETFQRVSGLLNLSDNEKLIQIDKNNFSQFKNQILDIQKAIYEPTRQTSIDLFETIASHPASICLGITVADKLSAICFSGVPALFKSERGLRRHEDFNNKSALYTADTTILRELRGRNLGRDLKYATVLLGMTNGSNIFIGRNRDTLAAKMQLINLSLGCYEYDYIHEDYLDDEENRNVIHYKIDLRGQENLPYLSDEHNSPSSARNINIDTIKSKLPKVVNKVCLSNFVSNPFLVDIKYLFERAPKELRHGYTASGQSECVDKIVKSIWSKTKRSNKMLTFSGHYFGAGSFLSRTLSQVGKNFFPVDIIDNPTENNYSQILQQLENLLNNEAYLGIWIEPVRQLFMDKVPTAFLQGLKKLANKTNTPLIYNETISKRGIFDIDNYYASNDNSIQPDVIMSYEGGQSAIVNLKVDYFIEKPLMLISTWDGDEFSMSLAKDAAFDYLENTNEVDNIRKLFTENLKKYLTKYNISSFNIENSIGHFKGVIPKKHRAMFNYLNGRYLVNPHTEEMKIFNKLFNEGIL